MMLMSWNALINSECLFSAQYLSTHMNENFLSWLLNVLNWNLRMSIGGSFHLDIKPKGYKVKKYIATNVEVNSRMVSTLRNEKSIWSMNPGENFETSMLAPLEILVALVTIQIGQGYSKSGRVFGRPFMRNFFYICCNPEIETRPKSWWKSWEIFCFERPHIVVSTTYLFIWELTLTN